MPTTFRADTRAGLVTAVQAFITAQPTMLHVVYTSRPSTFSGDTPFAYVDLLGETIAHDSGTRTRTMQPSVVVVGRPTENAQQTADWDLLVDALVDHFTDYAHISPNTIWDAMTVTDDSEEVQSEQGVRTFPAVRFQFGNVSAMEGRA